MTAPVKFLITSFQSPLWTFTQNIKLYIVHTSILHNQIHVDNDTEYFEYTQR